MPSPAQTSDSEEISELYRHNHSGSWRTISPEVEHRSQMFVIKDGGQLVGMALVGYVYYGLDRTGILYELEVAREADGDETARSLIEASLRWLMQLGAGRLWATPASDQERALLHRMGFHSSQTTGMSCLVPVQMARQVTA